MKPFGYDKYQRVTNDRTGELQYIRKPSSLENDEELDRLDSVRIPELKNKLEALVALRSKMTRDISNRDLVPFKGKERSMRKYDTKQITKEIEKLKHALNFHGVRVIPDALMNGKVVYKEGGYNMYTEQKLKEMKLQVYQENAAGEISPAVTKYLTAYFDIKMESVKNNIDGLITEYLEACKSGDEEKKEEVKEKMSSGSDDGRDEKISELKKKLEEAEKYLTDDEKKAVKELQEKIDAGEDVDAPTTESGETPTADTDVTSTNTNTTSKKPANPENSTVPKNTDEAEKLLDTTSKELDNLMNATTESVGLSEEAQEKLMDYIVESVAAGTMDSTRADNIVSIILG